MDGTRRRRREASRSVGKKEGRGEEERDVWSQKVEKR